MGKPTFIRTSSVVALAAIITLGLFFFMTELLGEKPKPPKPITSKPITIRFDKPVEEHTTKQRSKPEPHEPLPEVNHKAIAGETPAEPPTLLPKGSKAITPPSIPKITGKDWNFANSNKSATPMVQTQPQYPVDAAREGKEGWVVVKFDINKQGKVVNAKVIDADPKRTFDKAALRAVKNWKYQPKVDQGLTVAQLNQQVQLDFKLDN